MFSGHHVLKHNLFCSSQSVFQCKSKWTAKYCNGSINVEFGEGKKIDRNCDGQFSITAWPNQSAVIQTNTHLEIAMKVFCECGSHPSLELK